MSCTSCACVQLVPHKQILIELFFTTAENIKLLVFHVHLANLLLGRGWSLAKQ